MAEFIFFPFIIIAIAGIGVAMFGGWLFVVFAKGVMWVLETLFASPQLTWREPTQNSPPTTRTCGACGQGNPPAAKFCRRCRARFNA